MYKIGNRLIEIPKKAVEKIIEWNEGAMCNDVEYDRKICRSLLLSLVSKDDLCACKVHDDVLNFIKGIDLHLFYFADWCNRFEMNNLSYIIPLLF